MDIKTLKVKLCAPTLEEPFSQVNCIVVDYSYSENNKDLSNKDHL